MRLSSSPSVLYAPSVSALCKLMHLYSSLAPSCTSIDRRSCFKSFQRAIEFHPTLPEYVIPSLAASCNSLQMCSSTLLSSHPACFASHPLDFHDNSYHCDCFTPKWTSITCLLAEFSISPSNAEIILWISGQINCYIYPILEMIRSMQH